MQQDEAAARALTKERRAFGVAAKGTYLAAHPTKRRLYVGLRPVTRRIAAGDIISKSEETKRADTIIDADDDGILRRRELRRIVWARLAKGILAARHVDQDGQIVARGRTRGRQIFKTKQVYSSPYVETLLRNCKHAGPNLSAGSGRCPYGATRTSAARKRSAWPYGTPRNWSTPVASARPRMGPRVVLARTIWSEERTSARSGESDASCVRRGRRCKKLAIGARDDAKSCSAKQSRGPAARV